MSNTNDVQAKKKIFKKWWFLVIVAAIIPGIISSLSTPDKLQAGKASEAPSVIPQDSVYKEGNYKVGQDIPAGKYKTTLKDDVGHLKVSGDILGNLTITKFSTNTPSDSYITVEDGQYIESSGIELSN